MKKTFKKIVVVTISISLLSNFLFILPLLAETKPIGEQVVGSLKKTAGDSYNTTPTGEFLSLQIMNVVAITLTFIGVLFLLLVIYGGYLWMTSGGNEEQVAKAKKILIAAIIGVAIVLVARIIAEFIIINIGTSVST